MRYAYKEKVEGPVTEMAIVNTFTKLIFGEDAYSAREQSIIDAFLAVDASVTDKGRKAMGDYLRNLGVWEMIQLVSDLRQYLEDCSYPKRAAAGVSGHPRRLG